MPRAQRATEPEVKVTGVASHASDKEAVVSISGDGNLTRAQTWQDRDGTFHVVLPKGQTALRNSAGARGVKIQRIGDSLEIIVQAKPGSGVTVQPRFNRLDLLVSGGLRDGSGDDAQVTVQTTGGAEFSATGRARTSERSRRQDATEQASQAVQTPQASQTSRPTPRGRFAAVKAFVGAGVDSKNGQQGGVAPEAKLHLKVGAQDAQAVQSGAAQANALSESNVNGATATGNAQSASPANGAQPANGARADSAANDSQGAQVQTTQTQSSFGLLPLSLVSLLGVAGLGAFLFVQKRRRRSGGVEVETEEEEREEKEAKPSLLDRLRRTEKADASTNAEPVFEQSKGDRRKGGDRRMIDRKQGDRRKNGAGAESQATRQTHPQGALELSGERHGAKWEISLGPASPMPSMLFGAYRIEQEVMKLVNGEAHSIEVLASRATDDRRAIETSLIKVLRAPDADQDNRRRARTALEEYGFVARQSAVLLLAPEAYERASAARVLGEVKSSSALPFLLEALYDSESVVRTEVVSSLGSLRLPRAIGALIDMARRYPEMPANLLRPALSACSVDSLEIEGSEPAVGHTYIFQHTMRTPFTGDIVGLEPPVAVEQLPEWLEDESLADALERLGDTDIEVRTLAAQKLAQFQVQRSVDALAAMAERDTEPAVRASAVTSLGVVDHESVFAPVLMAMGDEAREVRAAAARALSRLSFDRADAYVRVIETADTETLRGVAQACVKAGLAAQALDRLTSEDRRQAYEAFSLLSLVVKAGDISLMLDAIVHHGDHDVRLAVIRLLCMMGRPSELVEPLRRLSGRGSMPEKVRVALLEAVGHIEQSELVPAPVRHQLEGMPTLN